MASTFSFNRFFFLSENNIICYLSQNIIVEQQPVCNLVFSGEMSENAPVEFRAVLPALLRTEWAVAPRPLKDLPNGHLAVLPEIFNLY